jgi:hypothetical protein
MEWGAVTFWIWYITKKISSSYNYFPSFLGLIFLGEWFLQLCPKLPNFVQKPKRIYESTHTGSVIHCLNDDWIQTCLLDRSTCNFHSFKFVYILILAFKHLYGFKTPFYKYSIAQRVQVCFTSLTNIPSSKHDP